MRLHLFHHVFLVGVNKNPLYGSILLIMRKLKKSICQVITSDNKICGYPVTSKNTTNLKTHLHRHHADKYEVFLKDDNHNKLEKKKASGR